jgi:putative oxidoreductase
MKTITSAGTLPMDAAALGITALRVVVGMTFLMHGWQKLAEMGLPATAAFFGKLGVPAPELAAAMVTAFEIIGGIALLAGFLSRWVAIPLAIDMLAAISLFHLPRGFFVGAGGVELALLLLAGLVALALNGSGALSLDGLLSRARPAARPFSRPMRPVAASGHH